MGEAGGCIKIGLSSLLDSERPVQSWTSKNILPKIRKAKRIVDFQSEENKEAPETATDLKTQKIDRSENLLFRVRCAFGCSLFPFKRAP